MSVISMILSELKNMALPCLISLPVIVIIRYLTYKKTGVLSLKREALIIVFFVYLVAVLSATFVPSDEIRNGPDRAYFHLPDFSDPDIITYKTSPIGWVKWMLVLGRYDEIARNIFGNVLVFVPYGFLMPIIWKSLRAKTVLFGFLLSLFIEFSQLFIDRQTDVYDLILNTFGVLLGYIIFLIARKIKRSKSA